MEKKVPKRVVKRVGVFGHSFVELSQEHYIGKLNSLCPRVKFYAHGKAGSGTSWVVGALEATEKGKYDEIIIQTGVNEIAAFREKNAERQLARMERKLRKAIRIAKRKGAGRVLLVEATPWKGYKVWDKGKHVERWSEWKGEYTKEFNRMLGRLAEKDGVEVVRLYDLMEDGEEVGAMKKEYTKDCLHPNRRGQEAMAEAVAEAGYPEWVRGKKRLGEKERREIVERLLEPIKGRVLPKRLPGEGSGKEGEGKKKKAVR